MNNGIASPDVVKLFFYSKTIVGISSTNTRGYAFDCCYGNNGPGAFENNVLSTVNNFGGWLTSLSTTIDYNVYGNATGAGSLRWACNGSATNTFATSRRAVARHTGSLRPGR